MSTRIAFDSRVDILHTMKDRVYSEVVADVGDFIFDEKVANVFQDMISRSVPGYEMSLAMLTLIAKRFSRPDTRVYELGCSLGAALLAIASGVSHSSTRLIGVDSSKAMLQGCEKNLQEAGVYERTELRCEDIQDTPIENASIVVLNFTLQFIPKADRLPLLRRIYDGLASGGILLLSEKICFDDALIQENLFDLHHDFKRMHGYSDLEISQKRNALENVLIPETLAAHAQRIQESGFGHVSTWFQCFNFTSLLAIK